MLQLLEPNILPSWMDNFLWGSQIVNVLSLWQLSSWKSDLTWWQVEMERNGWTKNSGATLGSFGHQGRKWMIAYWCSCIPTRIWSQVGPKSGGNAKELSEHGVIPHKTAIVHLGNSDSQRFSDKASRTLGGKLHPLPFRASDFVVYLPRIPFNLEDSWPARGFDPVSWWIPLNFMTPS